MLTRNAPKDTSTTGVLQGAEPTLLPQVLSNFSSLSFIQQYRQEMARLYNVSCYTQHPSAGIPSFQSQSPNPVQGVKVSDETNAIKTSSKQDLEMPRLRREQTPLLRRSSSELHVSFLVSLNDKLASSFDSTSRHHLRTH